MRLLWVSDKGEIHILNQDIVVSNLRRAANGSIILENEPMRKHTSFKIGGPAAVMFIPNSEEAAQSAVNALKDVKYTVIGNGSNLLVRDEGYDGVVIKISAAMSGVETDGDIITAQSGAALSKVGNAAKTAQLSGFEFACGIPGTVGGAVYMNAGAYGGEMKDIVISSRCMDENGAISEVTEHNFGYRTSVYKDSGKIILSAKFRLAPGNADEIGAKMLDFAKRRSDKQPLEYPSAGSVFKRPEGYFAGQLIEQAGLKGYRIGGACVSEKHSGFIINQGGATCSDVLALIEHIKETVYRQFGVELEQEVKVL